MVTRPYPRWLQDLIKVAATLIEAWEGDRHVKPYAYRFFAAFVLTAFILTFTGCQQMPASASTTPSTTSAPVPLANAANLLFAKYRFGFLEQVRKNREHPRDNDAGGQDHP